MAGVEGVWQADRRCRVGIPVRPRASVPRNAHHPQLDASAASSPQRAIALLILVASALMMSADLVRRGVSLGSRAPGCGVADPATGAATTSPSAPSITAAPVAARRRS
jgi:hypothetical protein